MAENVKVVCDEWNSIKGQINGKVEAINNTLIEFDKILDKLTTEGIIEGGGRESILTFKENIISLKDCISYIHKNIEDTIISFTSDIEEIDHNK